MRTFLLICAALLLLSLAKLPIGYYTFLRITVFIASIAVVLTEYKNGFGPWIFLFVLIGILFNPIIPVYLSKSIWTPIDIVCSLIFIVKAFNLSPKPN